MPEINESREDNWVAALCHFSVMIFFIGMIVPTVVFITQKDRSPRLRFQAMQALIYQGIGAVMYLLFSVVMMVFGFGVFFLTLAVSFSGPLSQVLSVAYPLLSLLLTLFSIVFGLVIVPLYYILGLVGGWRNVRKSEFRYPLLGGWVKSMLKMDS